MNDKKEPELQDSSSRSCPMWSLAELPEVILVKIMEYLNLKDKYHLSITCQTFYDLFSHPNLWKTVHINLMQTGGRHSRWQFQAVMHKTMCEIVERFAHLFQHLTMKMSCMVQPFDKTLVKLLKELSKECRLESLSLEVGLLESSDEDIQLSRIYLSNMKDVHLLTGLLRTARRLKHLTIVSWPLHGETVEHNLFQAMLTNEKLKSLQSLSLFYIDEKKQWTGRVPLLPSPEQITEVISFLRNLTHISLRSPMINDQLILQLATEKRKSLETLKVLVMWSRPNSSHPGFKIPEVRDRSWSLLKKNSPHLGVNFVIHIRIPFDELVSILRPDVPVRSISILKYGQCQSALIDSVISKYSNTLTSFISFCDSDHCDAALLNLTRECPNLRHLTYHGSINYRTIMNMATFLKDSNREMTVFEFKEKSVKTEEESVVEGEEDDDIVIRQNVDTQEYFIAGIHAWHVDEDLHWKKIHLLLEHVRNCLDISWHLQ